MNMVDPGSLQCSWLTGDAAFTAGTARFRLAPAAELAVANRAAFVAGLRQLGLRDREHDALLDLRDEVAAVAQALDVEKSAIARASYRLVLPPESVRLAQERRAALRRLDDWFASYTFDAHAVATSRVRIPLFLITSPYIAGCSARLSSARWGHAAQSHGSYRTHLCFIATIFGGGGGDGAVCKVATKTPIEVKDGEPKVIFIAIEMTTSRVTVRRRNREVGRGIRVEVSCERDTALPGVLTLAPAAEPPAGPLIAKYAIEDTHPVVTKVQALDLLAESRETHLTLEAFGEETTITALVSCVSPARLDCELVGGYAYEAYEASDCLGVTWRAG